MSDNGGELRSQPLRTAAALASPGLVIGALLFAAVLAWSGVAEVAAALATGGVGLFGVAAYHLIPLLADSRGWRCLLAPRPAPFRVVVAARWIGESMNGLLPVLQIGGNVAKGHYLARHGVAGVTAAASVVVDITLVFSTQILFTLLGLLVLVLWITGGGQIAAEALIGTCIFAAMGFAFLALQRRGIFGWLAHLASRLLGSGRFRSLAPSAQSVDAEVSRLYGDRRALLSAAAWHLASWVIGTGEVWLALQVLGKPIDLQAALLLESLGQAVRGAAFFVPGALGVQEGSLILLGSLVGITPETAVALSLCKRFRDFVLGLPGLLYWWATLSRSSSGAS